MLDHNDPEILALSTVTYEEMAPPMEDEEPLPLEIPSDAPDPDIPF